MITSIAFEDHNQALVYIDGTEHPIYLSEKSRQAIESIIELEIAVNNTTVENLK